MSYKGHTFETAPLGIYELCLDVIKKYGLSPKRILDLGSHHGQGLKLLGDASHCERYVMVEPMAKNVAVIRSVLASRSSDSIPHASMFPGIVGKEQGFAKFYELQDNDESSNLYNSRDVASYGKADETIVPVATFDDITGHMGGRIDFLKCNIEGGEYQLIHDGFFNLVDSFLVEVHNIHCPRGDGTWMNVLDFIAPLQNDFELISHGELYHKYCFVSGLRIA